MPLSLGSLLSEMGLIIFSLSNTVDQMSSHTRNASMVLRFSKMLNKDTVLLLMRTHCGVSRRGNDMMVKLTL